MIVIKKDIDICSFGEILIDFTNVGTSETNQKLFQQNAGGAPANVLVCATKFGDKTAFLGKVGKDIHGEFLKQTLITENVNIDGLIVDNEYFTTLAFVDINEKGERSFSFARKHGADTKMTISDIDTDIIKKSKIFHVGSLSLTDENIKKTTVYAIEKAIENNCIISYDPNYRASLWSSEEIAIKEMRSLISYADVMKISDEECELLTGETNPSSAAKKLNDLGVKIACVTCGDNGAYVSYKGECESVAGFKAEKVEDTTGAGDSFWGGFLHKILKDDINTINICKLKEYVRFANAVASICVERKGAIAAMPNMEDVNKRLGNS